MGSPYDKVLTSAGVLEDGKVAKPSRDKFVAEVLALLVTGNSVGHGGSSSTKVFSSIVPLPPIAGPPIVNVTTLHKESLFWFDPDPFAALMSEQLLDKEKSMMWHTVFVDTLFGGTATALDMAGSTPLFPIFDVSGPFGIDLDLPFTPPELAAKLKMPVPKLMLKLADLKIELKPPSIPLPAIPPKLPDLLPPPIPGIVMPALPPLILIDMVVGLLKLPFDLLKKLVLPPALGLILDLPGLPKKVLSLALDLLIDLLTALGMLLTVPRLLMASLMIWLKNVVAMVCTDIVGLIVGSGNISKSVAKLTGLI